MAIEWTAGNPVHMEVDLVAFLFFYVSSLCAYLVVFLFQVYHQGLSW